MKDVQRFISFKRTLYGNGQLKEFEKVIEEYFEI